MREVAIEMERKQTSNAQASEQSENITVQISAQDEIWIKGRRIDGRSIRANISRLRAENPKAKVILQAHNASTVEVVTKVIDASREAGIYNVSLATGE